MTDPAPPRRRFLPQPVEVTTKVRASRTKEPTVAHPTNTVVTIESEPARVTIGSTPRRFKPEPVEMSTKSSRKRPPETTHDSSRRQHRQEGDLPKPKPTRRFAPQLLETTTRSRRSGDNGPVLSSADKTEVAPGDPVRATPRPRTSRAGQIARTIDGSTSSTLHDAANTVRGIRSRSALRHHAFRVPSLERITSSESEGSNCPSLSTSPSAASDEGVEVDRRSNKMRESCDDRFSGYLLGLAARAAEKQLREQAMAAFPNDDFHEPVDHFAVEEDSDMSDIMSDHARKHMTRRESVAELSWEAREMRKHHQHRHALGPPPGQDVPDRRNFHNPFADAMVGQQKEVDFDHMRDAAKPPMLGENLVFRMHLSPQATQLDVHQHPHPKIALRSSGVGLWRGFCTAEDADDQPPKTVSTGMVTPPNEETAASRSTSTAPTRNPSHASLSTLELEFSDLFVTQVYNYLSLGYPALAKKFDFELSKISRIPIDELRGEDDHGGATGFVGLEEGQGVDQEHMQTRGNRGRWKALRLYIREWARQNHSLDSAEAEPAAWGVRARKGSWAI
ncbi:MAG: hypothetical protein M1838_000066 [Thelocarpon superellum]|nr:MAG: hypothetical protein M1838_000066 [Thelocarpon superellum]